MIASNEVVAARSRRWAAVHPRVVKTPERWDRIWSSGDRSARPLPATPSSSALNEFLVAREAADPDHFPDLSLAVIK